MLRVSEAFNSIQGEGIHNGIPSHFIRFSKCILKCPYCDTKYSWKDGDINLSDIKIPDNIRHIVITGGEPFLHIYNEEFIDFIKKLLYNFKKITFETTGISSLEYFKTKSIVDSIFIFNEQFENINNNSICYMISPKLDSSCYPDNIANIENITKYYSNLVSIHDTFKNKNIFYKIVYYPEIEDKIKYFLFDSGKISPWFIENRVFLMPKMEIPYNQKKYTDDCKLTVNKCMEWNIRYSARIHIDIYGNIKGV